MIKQIPRYDVDDIRPIKINTSQPQKNNKHKDIKDTSNNISTDNLNLPQGLPRSKSNFQRINDRSEYNSFGQDSGKDLSLTHLP